MAIYCIKIKYTKEAIKGMMEEGIDRADAMRSLSKALGGKLLAFYGMVGQHYHVMAISEVPEYANLSAGIVTAMMANTLEDYKVIPLYESSDITKVSAMYKEVMSSYKRPGKLIS